MKQLLELKSGEKYTIVRFGDMGFVFSVQLALKQVKIESYAQYPESVVLIYLPKRKRSLRGMRFLTNEDYLVYPGWVEVATEMFVSSSKSETGFTVSQSLLSCDREYLMIAKRSVATEPLFEKITPMPNADTARICGR